MLAPSVNTSKKRSSPGASESHGVTEQETEGAGTSRRLVSKEGAQARLAEMGSQRKADEGEWFQRNNDLSLRGMNRLGGAERTEVSGVVMTAAH